MALTFWTCERSPHRGHRKSAGISAIQGIQMGLVQSVGAQFRLRACRIVSSTDMCRAIGAKERYVQGAVTSRRGLLPERISLLPQSHGTYRLMIQCGMPS